MQKDLLPQPVVVSKGSDEASKALEAALKRLAFVSVSAAPSADPAANERYHLARLNTGILAEVRPPKFLNRPPAPNYVDPRPTAPKHWRDVHHYADDGQAVRVTTLSDGPVVRVNDGFFALGLLPQEVAG
jgi:hypothetical protein